MNRVSLHLQLRMLELTEQETLQVYMFIYVYRGLQGGGKAAPAVSVFTDVHRFLREMFLLTLSSETWLCNTATQKTLTNGITRCPQRYCGWY